MNRIRHHVKPRQQPVDPRSPGPADVTLGKRIRQARNEAAMTQISLGEAAGVSYQQIQKIEYGTDRIAAIRLNAVAAATGKPLAWFFEEAER